MTRTVLAALLVGLAAAPATAQAPAAPRTTGVSAAQADSLVRLADDADRRWNERDAAGLSGAYTADGQMHIAGTPADLRGEPAIRAFFERAFAARTGRLRHRTVVKELQAVASGVVAADGEVWVDQAGADGAFRPVRHFTMHSLAVRTPEGWRIRVNRVHPAPLE